MKDKTSEASAKDICLWYNIDIKRVIKDPNQKKEVVMNSKPLTEMDTFQLLITAIEEAMVIEGKKGVIKFLADYIASETTKKVM